MLSLSCLAWLNNKIQFLLLLHIPTLLLLLLLLPPNSNFQIHKLAPSTYLPRSWFVHITPSSSKDPSIKRPSSLSLQRKALTLDLSNSLQFPVYQKNAPFSSVDIRLPFKSTFFQTAQGPTYYLHLTCHLPEDPPAFSVRFSLSRTTSHAPLSPVRLSAVTCHFDLLDDITAPPHPASELFTGPLEQYSSTEGILQRQFDHSSDQLV